MRFITWQSLVFVFVVQLMSGCGGGGGSSASDTQTVTVKLSSISSTPNAVIGGFDLKVTLPVGAAIAVDNAGIPTAQSVFLSGQFAGAALLPQNFLYDAG
ncbi:MAG: hypothetical protein PHI31_05735, partial [Desulfuromonadaceae bacterium]|nr:hypothetical protein [Desulfuromonadaceae bacterium]